VILGPNDDHISFFEQQIITTRNLGDTKISDFMFGGLNNHIEHHLFPNLPRRGLRRARVITRNFCRRHNITYRETNWLGAASQVSRFFGEVTESALAIRDETRATIEAAPIQESQKI
jgi:fatty acid desaturase